MKNKLIVFEGIDGSGKSTQAKMLADKLITLGYDAVYTFEPTNKNYGKQLRDSFFSGRLSPHEELSLFVKDRKEHIEQEITPWLKNNKIVVVDRYMYSSIAYQGALGIDTNYIKNLHNDFILKPNLIFIFTSDVDDCLSRIKQNRKATDQFENAYYLTKVEEIFRSFQGNSFKHINSSESIENIHAEILDYFNKTL